MLKQVSFRVIEDSDKNYLKALYADSRAREMNMTVWSDQEKTRFLDQQYEFQDRSFTLNYIGAIRRIIQLDGRDIGRLFINEADDHMRILDLTIHSDYQRRGIATDILKSLLNKAYGGKVPVKLSVVHDNPARKLYARLGFHPVRQDGLYVEMIWRPDLTPREV